MYVYANGCFSRKVNGHHAAFGLRGLGDVRVTMLVWLLDESFSVGLLRLVGSCGCFFVLRTGCFLFSNILVMGMHIQLWFARAMWQS